MIELSSSSLANSETMISFKEGGISLFCRLLLLFLVGLAYCQTVARSSNGLSVRHLAKVHQNITSSVQPKLSLQAGTHESPMETANIVLETFEAVYEVDPQFLSIALGVGEMERDWVAINFTAQRIVNMAKGLGPAMLRLGGTKGDFITFDESVVRSNFTNSTFGPAQWDTVNEFVESVGWEFIFGLDSLLRSPYPVGVWDSTNAAELMAYSNSKNYTVNWELGNEPNAWDRFNYTITPEEHAKDFSVLKALVSLQKPLGRMIVGPDVGSRDSTDYLEHFLQSLEPSTLDAVTYHHYYADGRTGIMAEFYNITLLDTFISTAVYHKTVCTSSAPGVDVWIGETASMYGGGTKGLSDSFIAGFMWLDKLGIAAVTGHKRLFRQDLVGGNYGLLDNNQNPLPDYWLSVLYKKLVGTKVLYVLGSLEYGRYLRAYAHCSKPPYPAGSVVLLLLNMNFTAVSADLVNSELASSERDVFWLSPPSGNLTSMAVQLNGLTLQLVENTELPDLKPEQQPASPSLSLPPISFGFIVFKEAKIHACQ